MKKITLSLLIVMCAVFSLTAQNSNKIEAENYLNTKGEVCFTFKANSSEQFKEISRFLSFGHGHVDKNDLTVEAYANKKTFAKFLEYGLPYQVNKGDNELLFNAHNSGTSKEAILAKSKNSKMMAAWDTTWDAYPTYSQYVAKMGSYVSAYPNICSLETIGTTPNGRALLVLKISDNVGIEEAEPEFLYTSSMHGNEITGYPLMIHLIDYLLTNYASDPEVQGIVNSTEIFINPLANPDGTYGDADTNIITSPSRYNSAGQDLNRNYPDNMAGLHDNGPVYQPETKAFMAFADSRDLVLTANFHDGTEVVNYPYDNTFTKHADHDFYEYISNEYAVNCQNYSPDNYYSGVSGRSAGGVSNHPNYMTVEYDDPENPSSPGVTQGVIWYQVYGGRQDYSNFYQHSKEVTVELAFQKFIDPAELPMLWSFNKQAFLDYLKQVNNGFQGTVKDESGNPVVAQIAISGHDKLNSHVFSNPDHGDYYKLIKGGTYTVTYSAPGYISQDISVKTDDDTKTIQNVTLIASTAKPTASNDQLCDSGTTTLNASGTGTLKWYDAENATTSIFTGANYTTPNLTSTTSYFVEDVISKSNVGNTSNNSGGRNHTSSGRYLIFDCTESVTLEQVTINANSSGDVEVQLQDSSGNVLDATVMPVNSGIQVIDLNFIIPVANNLRLVGKDFSTGGLYRNTSGISYPYTNGSISIKNSSEGTNRYHYFHDWKIGSIKSARKEVVVNIVPSPTANFTYITNPLNNGEVTFTNTSTDATSYSWDFGDFIGTSTSASPTYTFLETNTFDVVLTSTNAECGNDMITVQVSVTNNTLEVEDNELSETTVYPNPFNDNISIKLADYSNTIDLDVLLFDINGRTIFNEIQSSNNKIINISNLNKLQQGLYFLKITNNKSGQNTVRQLFKK